MIRFCRFAFLFSLVWLAAGASARAVELRMGREALERTLKQQLFTGPGGRYYLKGDAKSACFVYAEKPELSFAGDRVVVQVQIHARLGKSIGGKCIGVRLHPTSQVSMIPDAEGETIGYRDARVERVSESKELNFLLMPFMSHQIPSSMKVDAADVIRKSLTGSALTTGYTVTLDRMKIHSMVLQGDWLVVDVDGDMTVT